MLVNWTKNCTKGIPVGDSQVLILSPGYNDVDDNTWDIARSIVIGQIENKEIEEEWTKVKKDEYKKASAVYDSDYKRVDGTKHTSEEAYVPATLQDFRVPRACQIVLKTYNKATLNKWNLKETRDEVTKNINYQIMWIDEPSKAQDMYGQNFGHGDKKE